MDVILPTVELLPVIITAMLTLYIWWTYLVQSGVPFTYFLTMITMGYFAYRLIKLNST